MSSVTADDQSFQRYLESISARKTLTREDELALARRWVAEREPEAAQRLVEANLRFVVKIALSYRGYGLKVADLVEEGNLGLLEAVQRFDPERGHRFMTYAAHWIRAYILAYVLKFWSLVGVGTGPVQSKLFFGLKREAARLTARHGTSPDTVAQLAQRFNTSEDRIVEMQQRLTTRDLSLDAPGHGDTTVSRIDRLVDEGQSQESGYAARERDRLVRERVQRARKDLSRRERYILERRLLADDQATLAEVGAHLGLSRERVRQLEGRIKEKLRHVLADLETPELQAVA